MQCKNLEKPGKARQMLKSAGEPEKTGPRTSISPDEAQAMVIGEYYPENVCDGHSGSGNWI